MIKDLVCGMDVELNTPYRYDYNGVKYYFCSSSCLAKFKRDSKSFCIDSKENIVDKSECCKSCSGNEVYYCPMCEGVESSQFGSCSKCGMDLVLKGFDLNSFNDLKTNDDGSMKKSLIITIILFIPVLLSYINKISGYIIFDRYEMSSYIEFVSASLILFYSSRYILVKGIVSIYTLSLNMFTLIFLGVAIAYLYSVYNIFYASSVNLYFDVVGIISIVVTVGQILEQRVNKKSNASMKDLANSLQSKVMLLIDNDEVLVDLHDIVAGDTVMFKAGEKISIDGTIIEGNSSIDEALLTGESIPVTKGVDDIVFAGTKCMDNMIKVKALKDGNSSYIYSLIEDINDISKSRVEISSLVDRISSYFTIGVILISIVTFVVWYLFNSDLNMSIVRAISVLLVACPCAIGIATPISLYVGITNSAKRGIFIKNTKVLSIIGSIDSFVFDKTGTLTTGKILLEEFKNLSKTYDDDKLLSYANSIESLSNHPYAKAICNFSKIKGVNTKFDVKEYKYHVSRGVTAIVDGKKIEISNKNSKEKISNKYLSLFIDGVTVAIFSFSDTLKGGSYSTVKNLILKNKKVYMLTGDSYENAKNFANELSIELIANQSGKDKENFVKNLQDSGSKVAMIGDGINDALVLSKADLSISMGDGVSLANSSSDVVLLKGEIGLIKELLDTTDNISLNIKQNLFFAFIYNIFMILISTGALYRFSITITPIMASVFMSLSSITVIMNALRLNKRVY